MSLMWLRQLAARMRGGEDGQVLILFIVLTPVIFLASAIAIDYGLWLSERRGVARAADLSSLAAVQDLPATPGQQSYASETDCAGLQSCRAAFEWAKRNQYGEPNAEVTVSYWCGNDIQFTPANICHNENAGGSGAPTPCPNAAVETNCDTIRVTVEKPAVRLFAGLFPAFSFDVGFSADASVNYRIQNLDAVMSIDASGSMQGDPIVQARIAANKFSTILLGDDPQAGNVQIGYAPYTTCYDPPTTGGNQCVPSIHPLTTGNCNPPPDPATDWLLCLMKENPSFYSPYYDATTPGGYTNVCLGLFESGEILRGPNRNNAANAQRFVVILTDGENNFQAAPGVPNDCRPVAAGCGTGAPGSQERLDVCTDDVADDLKGEGVEIYVIGLNVDGTNDGALPTGGYCSGIGGGVNNRRLLKCMASSNPGTNDHYKETDNAVELGDIFQGVAYEIAGRGLSSGN